MSSIKNIRESAKIIKDNIKKSVGYAKEDVKDNLKKAKVSAKHAKDSVKESFKNIKGSGKEKFVNEKLEKSSKDLKRIYQSMERKFGSLKKSVSSRIDKYKILKDAKSIIRKYLDDYEAITINGLKNLEGLSEDYGIVLSEKFKIELNKALFSAMKSTAKKTILTEKTLRVLFQKIFNDLNQTGQIDGAFKDPFGAFMQLFVKFPLLLSSLIKEVSRDDYSLFQICKIKKEMESTVLKKFPIIDITKLRNDQYRSGCKEKLEQFTERITSLILDINEDVRKLGNSDSQERFLALVTACFR